MVTLKSIALAVIGTLLFMTMAHAQSGITTQWFYGGYTYPNQGAAVAAMQAAAPGNSVLTVQSPAGMGPNTTQYQYTAPTPLPATPATVYYAGEGPSFPTENEALDYIVTLLDPPNQCGPTVAIPNGMPVYTSNLGSPSFGPGFTQAYTLTYRVWDIYTGCSGPITTTANFIISFWTSNSCPAYYTLNGTQCVDNSYADITSTTLPCQKPSTLKGDPCDAASGEFTQTETDYSGPSLTLTRYYHSATLESFHGLGVGWTHNYAATLVLSAGVPQGLLRPDGHHDPLVVESGSVYQTLSGDGIHVQPSGSNWIAYLNDGSTEVYNSAGVLIQLVNPGGAVTTLNYTNGYLSSVVDPFGHSLLFAYNANNQISTVTDPAGKSISYSYDSYNNLASVQYQDSTTRVYQYTNTAFPNNLTNIIDESGVTFLTVTYDSTGRASSSQNAGGANFVSLTYSATSAIVVDGVGTSTAFGFVAPANYAPRVTSTAINGLTTQYVVPPPSVDPQQRATQMTDANGNITQYAYGADHLMSTTEAYGTPRVRMTSYQYLNNLSTLPTLITEPLRQTSIVYYPGTNDIQIKTITDTTVTPNVSRTWAYTYNSYGQVLTVDGPRTDVADVTTYTYYTCTSGNSCGQIDTIKNALGQITTYNTYNAHGKPLTITDPNGVLTTLTYDARQRLLSRQVGTETTTYSYYPTGQLKLVTMPDGSTILNAYDGAHRLTDITDGLGNHIRYKLDAMGNHISQSTYDPTGVLRRSHSQVINTLNQLFQDVNEAGTAAVTTTFGYDANGNQTSVAAPLGRNTTKQYDELNRLKQITDPKNGITQLSYDANDSLVSVVDPRSLTTAYTHNGFGDLTKVVSPDSGTTASTYDFGGNLKTTQDARNAVATYSYDALNRVTQVAYTDQTINYTYDQGTNGKGRLTAASDASHAMSWNYDFLGRVIGKGQTVGGVTKSVGYGYANGDQTSLVTPSGQTITYGYTNHQITSIAVNGAPLLSGVTYFPYGSVSGWQWGNGTAVTRTYDIDGKLVAINTAADTLNFGYDNAFRIQTITDTGASANSWTLGYDLLDRISSASKSETPYGWTYDANGNRLTQTGTNASTFSISPTSNRLNAITGAMPWTYSYDAAGNTQTYSNLTFTYNNRGRPTSISVGGTVTSYIYNAVGQLIKKSWISGGVILLYDEAGHILGEYSLSGALIQETVWMGDIPVATLQPSGSSVAIYYIHSDQLNAPRKITRPSDNGQMWRWDADPFGSRLPNANPYGFGTFTYNLRFPGQYYQVSTNQNGFRDYDSNTGRYLQSDPVGLRGGLNTYSYVENDPIDGIDPFGRSKIYGQWCGGDWTGGYKKSWDQLTPAEQGSAKSPVDPLDYGCMLHDKCYAACRGNFPCKQGKRSDCFLGCDRFLENWALSFGGYMGDVIAGVMARPGSRNEPNAANCPTCGASDK